MKYNGLYSKLAARDIYFKARSYQSFTLVSVSTFESNFKLVLMVTKMQKQIIIGKMFYSNVDTKTMLKSPYLVSGIHGILRRNGLQQEYNAALDATVNSAIII